MSKKFLTDIDLSKNELMNAVIHALTQSPANPAAGQLYYNTNEKTMYQYDGTVWKLLGKVYQSGNGITISSDDYISADFATIAQAEAGSSTTKVMSPALVKAVIQTLNVSGFNLGVVTERGDTITIYGLEEVDGKVNINTNRKLDIKIDAEHGYDANSSPLATTGTVAAAQSASAVTLETGTESETNLVSYTLKQGGTTVGTINIPKFLVVKSGSVVTGTWSGNTFTEDVRQPGTGTGKAIKLVLNDSEDAGTADDVLYINVADLVDVYTPGAGIEITNGNVVKAKMVTETNGSLASVSPSDTAGRQYPVVPDSNGNMSVNVPWENTDTNEGLGQGYATCNTQSQTLPKVARLDDFVLKTGGIVTIKFKYSVPANSTLNVSATGWKSIFYKGVAIVDGIIQDGDTAVFMYDGTQYQLLAVDRVCKNAITAISWTVGNKHVTLTFADNTTSNVNIHPTNTSYPASGDGAAIPTEDQTPSFGGTFYVPQVVTDDFGHVTVQNTRRVTIPSIEATQSGAGLMSAEDKAKLDLMTYQVKQYSVLNPALTYNSTTGTCAWTIIASSVGNASDLKNAMCSLRDSNGDEVFADIRFSQASIVVTINASAAIAANTYTANILVPVAL